MFRALGIVGAVQGEVGTMVVVWHGIEAGRGCGSDSVRTMAR